MVSAELYRLDGGLDVAVGAEDRGAEIGVGFQKLLQQFHPVAIG